MVKENNGSRWSSDGMVVRRIVKIEITFLSMSCRQIFGVGTGKARLCKINLKEEHDEFLDWFRPSGE
jgi:hypothetical protein